MRLTAASVFFLGFLAVISASPQSSALGSSGVTAPTGGGAGAEAPPAGTTPGAVTSPAGDFDPTQLIGLDLKAALDSLGAPQEVFSFRGQDDTEDNVVFFYSDYLYLFWYRNRVWQVRCDHRFARPLFGLAMGMPREVIERTSAHPLIPRGDSLYFDLDDSKYPLRVRLVFAGNALADIYVYRSDF